MKLLFFLAAAGAAELLSPPLNPLVIEAEYAVRGAILNRAMEIEAELAAGVVWPFESIVFCNIGNPQALGQPPPAFARRVLARVVDSSTPAGDASADVLARADAYKASIAGGVGAYSESQGIALVRGEVAAFLTQRDGVAADASSIFLTDGASAGVRHVMQLLLRGQGDAVLAPAPQYPLYSALATLCNATLAPYYLDEEDSWGAPLAELERAFDAAVARGAAPRALVVINPGNPTGASLPRASLEEIVRFCHRRQLVLLADEVYQENVYANAPAFISFKRVAAELEASEGVNPPLVSFHSISKGFTGECGLRGGFLELHNVDAEVKAQLLKLASISLCANVLGQIAVGLMVKPPAVDGPDHAEYAAGRAEKLAGLERRAILVADALDALEGVTCRRAAGAMYLFPSLTLPNKAVLAAAKRKLQPDAFYSLRLLEATGLVVVPGSGFGQKDGTWHFRTTFLPPEKDMRIVTDRLKTFHSNFLNEFKEQSEL